jgi:APA family basic amino acid/polyamine antiporter
VKQTLGQKLLRTKTLERKREDGHDTGASQLTGVGLNRTLGLFPLTMIGVGATIGTGIFFTMVEAVPKAGPAVVLSFLLAAITAGLTALCYAELADRVPAPRIPSPTPPWASSPPSSSPPACCWNTGWPAAPPPSAGPTT